MPIEFADLYLKRQRRLKVTVMLSMCVKRVRNLEPRIENNMDEAYSGRSLLQDKRLLRHFTFSSTQLLTSNSFSSQGYVTSKELDVFVKRPSDRRGPWMESQGRNVRSKCRCSCVLQFTRRRAVCCVFHRPTSRVIRRSG